MTMNDVKTAVLIKIESDDVSWPITYVKYCNRTLRMKKVCEVGIDEGWFQEDEHIMVYYLV